MPKGNRQPMSDDHKAALAEGRRQGKVVRSYLEALEQNRPKRGRKRTPESIDKRLATIAETIDDASAIERLSLVQERIDLAAEREQLLNKVDVAEFEQGFIQSARAYGERKGISYAAWREIGVEASVLKAAGITRGT